MRHRRMPLIAATLLALIFGPYLLALAALLIVLWLAAMLIALPFSYGRRR